MRKLEDWIDYMEGEADLKTMGRLGLLIEHSRADREVLSNLMRMRMLIEHADPAIALEPLTEKAGFLDRLHDRVMTFIEEGQRGRGRLSTSKSSASGSSRSEVRADDSKENSSALD